VKKACAGKLCAFFYLDDQPFLQRVAVLTPGRKIMNDAEFLQAFEACTLHPFHHRDHIRLAWLYLSHNGWEQGYARIQTGIQRFAVAQGAHKLYHETITRFWALSVHNALRAGEDFVTFEAKNPHLFDKTLILQFYSAEVLKSQKARSEWVAPD
jgi:hypothetical protein